MVTFIPAVVSAETAAGGVGDIGFNVKTSAEMERLEKEYGALHGPAPMATLPRVADHIELARSTGGRGGRSRLD